ncbi:MAG: cell division protein ZapA [Hungatella sp.]
MTDKNYAEVLIDGKIYTLGGAEEEHYLQKVASYINEKISQLRRQEGFSKQSQEYQAVMVELNIADDYFKTKDQAMNAQKLKDDMERETYNLKHELVTTQMKLEAALHDLEEEKRAVQQTLSQNANNHGNNHGNNNRNTNRK